MGRLYSQDLHADVADARAAWRSAQPNPDPDRLVFIDETWAITDMARRADIMSGKRACRADKIPYCSAAVCVRGRYVTVEMKTTALPLKRSAVRPGFGSAPNVIITERAGFCTSDARAR